MKNELNTMKNTIALFAVLFLGAFQMQAQQDPMFSQYMFNTLSINPAYAGSADLWTFNAIYRHQWTQFDGAPVTQTITGHGTLLGQNIGIGGSIINDKHGPIKQTGIYADASYYIPLERSRIAFGLKAGVNFFDADLMGLSPTDGGDPVFQSNISYKPLPNFGAGFMWYSRNHFVGLSVPKIMKNKLIDGEMPDFENNEERQHFFFTAGYVFDINSYLKFKPTFLVKAVEGAPISYDVTANFLFYEKLWVGAMYRKTDAVGGLLQYEVNRKIRIGYAYDYILSDIGSYSPGTHEIMLNVDLFNQMSGDVSPRYF